MKKLLYIIQAILALPLFIIGYICVTLVGNIMSADNTYLDRLIEFDD